MLCNAILYQKSKRSLIKQDGRGDVKQTKNSNKSNPAPINRLNSSSHTCHTCNPTYYSSAATATTKP